MTHRLLPLIVLPGLLAGCSLAPAYHVPTSVAPTAAFKADPGWVPANPSDAVAKGAWWTLFGDDTLNALESRVAVTNQNLAYYRASYAQALAVVRVDKAALLPTVGANAGITTQGTVSGRTTGASSTTPTTITISGTASWAPDLWGALGNTVKGARANAEASAAQLANATLSAQGTLATDYFTLRGIDAQAAMLDTTIASYQRSLQVSQNKYAAGTVSSADVDSARTSLENAQASRRDLERLRVANETAIAVLVGENPSTFALSRNEWHPVVPAVPPVDRPVAAAGCTLTVAPASVAGSHRSAAPLPSESALATVAPPTVAATLTEPMPASPPLRRPSLAIPPPRPVSAYTVRASVLPA